MFFQVQLRGAGEHGGGTTCVDVMHNAVEQLGGGGSAGVQQRWKFLKQLLYLWRKSGDSSGGVGAPGANERGGTCLGEGAA